MYKNIVPGLISLDTELKLIKGLHISQNLNFFDSVKEKNKFHYKVILKNDIKIPTDYDFRNEYFIKKGECWYYERKIIFWYLKFEYNVKEKIFNFNKIYSFLPFTIGGIVPVGTHIIGMIMLDLFLAGFIYDKGIAFQADNKNICFFAPGLNGKTSFLGHRLKKGAKYIAEDILIIDVIKSEVYFTCPFLKHNIWQNRKIDETLKINLKNSIFFNGPLSIDNIYLFQNSLSLNYQPKNKNCFDFFLFNSLKLLNYQFAKSYIFEEGLSESVFDQVIKLKKINIKYKFMCVKNFNINSIL